MQKERKNRNFLARDLWQNPLFRKQVIPDKKKQQLKRLTRTKVETPYG